MRVETTNPPEPSLGKRRLATDARRRMPPKPPEELRRLKPDAIRDEYADDRLTFDSFLVAGTCIAGGGAGCTAAGVTNSAVCGLLYPGIGALGVGGFFMYSGMGRLFFPGKPKPPADWRETKRDELRRERLQHQESAQPEVDTALRLYETHAATQIELRQAVLELAARRAEGVQSLLQLRAKKHTATRMLHADETYRSAVCRQAQWIDYATWQRIKPPASQQISRRV